VERLLLASLALQWEHTNKTLQLKHGPMRVQMQNTSAMGFARHSRKLALIILSQIVLLILARVWIFPIQWDLVDQVTIKVNFPCSVIGFNRIAPVHAIAPLIAIDMLPHWSACLRSEAHEIIGSKEKAKCLQSRGGLGRKAGMGPLKQTVDFSLPSQFMNEFMSSNGAPRSYGRRGR
jgi:hypothetical protein